MDLPGFSDPQPLIPPSEFRCLRGPKAKSRWPHPSNTERNTPSHVHGPSPISHFAPAHRLYIRTHPHLCPILTAESLSSSGTSQCWGSFLMYPSKAKDKSALVTAPTLNCRPLVSLLVLCPPSSSPKVSLLTLMNWWDEVG